MAGAKGKSGRKPKYKGTRFVQLRLYEQDFERLLRLRNETGKSLSALVREAVSQALEQRAN